MVVLVRRGTMIPFLYGPHQGIAGMVDRKTELLPSLELLELRN